MIKSSLFLFFRLICWFCFFTFLFILIDFCWFFFVEFPHSGKSIEAPQSSPMVHRAFPRTSWSHVRPCNQYFDENMNYNRARSCSNAASFFETGQTVSNSVSSPKCFVITSSSPDVRHSPVYKMNGVILYGPISRYVIVGLYEPTSETIFLVENYDLPMIYRHELQHYFQFKIDPEAKKKDHEGLVWDVCEPKTYTPSKEQKEVIDLMNKNK